MLAEAPHPQHPGVYVREFKRPDGSTGQTFTIRWRESNGTKPRRTFDSLGDALDFRAKRQTAKRWRPEELRQERAGKTTLVEFFEEWWVERAMVELKRTTLSVYRCLWQAHCIARIGGMPLRQIDARVVVRFRGELLAAGVGPTSVVKTMSMLQRVFRDAVEYGEVAFNPFKAVQKPSAGPSREVHPLSPLHVERLAGDVALRGYEMSAVLVRLMAYTGMRPQEALALHWYAVRKNTLLVELANTDGELDRLKNRKRSRKRSRTIDLIPAVREDLAAWRSACPTAGDRDLLSLTRPLVGCGWRSTTGRGGAGSTSHPRRTSACRPRGPTTCGTRGRRCSLPRSACPSSRSPSSSGTRRRRCSTSTRTSCGSSATNEVSISRRRYAAREKASAERSWNPSK